MSSDDSLRPLSLRRLSEPAGPTGEPRDRLLAVAAGATALLLAVVAGVLALHAMSEGSRTAESVCRSALLSITPSTTFVEPLRVRALDGIDTAAEPEVAEVVDNYAPGPLAAADRMSTYIVQGDVRFGHAKPQSLTCLVVLEGGTAVAAPVFATASK